MASERPWLEELLLEEELRRLRAFDEGSFPPADETFFERVESGLKTVSGLRLAFGMLARNVEAVLWATIVRLQVLREMATESEVFVFENDSTDRTRDVLRIWAEHDPKVHIRMRTYGHPRWPDAKLKERASRMAHYRRQLRQMILERGPFDAVVILDSDLCGGWSYEGWASAWHDWPAWDAVTCQGLIWRDDGFKGWWYRDAWAYREQDWKDRPNIWANEKVAPKGSCRRRVRSAFGAMALYRYAAYASADYLCDGDCEHVSFCRTMMQNGFGRIWVDPSLIALYSDPWGHYRWWYERYSSSVRNRLLGCNV